MSTLLFSCSINRHLDGDTYILKKNTVILENSTNNKLNITKKEINDIIKQKPNKKITGLIPFHLWIYTLSNPTKNNWINNYLRKIGEAPVVLEKNLTQKSSLQIKSYFENNGYFASTIADTVIYKNNKAYVNYHIKTGNLYFIKRINYLDTDNSRIKELIQVNTQHSKLNSGDIFTYTALNNERIRIESLLQNNGYYKFSKKHIYVNADSTDNNFVDINFFLEETSDSSIYKQFNINNIFIKINNNNENQDTILYDNYYFINTKHAKLKLNTISDLITIKKNSIYSKIDAENTYRNLSNLSFFKKINIEFIETINAAKVDCYISVEIPTKMYYSIEAEAKRSTDEGDIAISSYVQFGNNNVFKGAENLNGKIRVSLGNRQASPENNEKIFNTKEISYEIGLRKPKLIVPKKIQNWLKNSFQMNTNFIFSVTQRERPDFSSQTIAQKLGYTWRTTNYSQHQFNLIELIFSDIEQNTFIADLVKENIYLQEQFEDKFIPSSNYTFTLNNHIINRVQNYTFLKTRIETSGNLFQLIGSMGNFNKDDNNNYMFFNNPFSQYVKIDFDIRRYLTGFKENTLVLRSFIGAGYAYGNSEKLPIQKQFFSGGVNSIRAWEAFSLGPGSSQDTIGNNYATGDLKLEFNIEYRFTFLNSLKSAIFIDAGNIWSIKEEQNSGSSFQINNFISELALGFGFGLRYDFDFFIIRLDMARPLRDPSYPRGDRWIENTLNKKFRYNLAIGYPF